MFGVKGKDNGKTASFSYFGLYGDIPIETFGYHFANGLSQAGTFGEFIQFRETIENGVLFFFRDTNAGIFYENMYMPPFLSVIITNQYISLLREFNSVAKKVGNHLCQPKLIRGNGYAFFRYLHTKFYVLRH